MVIRFNFSQSLLSAPHFSFLSSLFQGTWISPSPNPGLLEGPGILATRAEVLLGSLDFLLLSLLGLPPHFSLSFPPASPRGGGGGLSVWFKATWAHTGEKGVKATGSGKFRWPKLEGNGEIS